MEEMILTDSPQDMQRPELCPDKEQRSIPISRGVILSLAVFVLSFAVLFAGPALALRLMTGPMDIAGLVGGAGAHFPDVHASQVVTDVVLQQGRAPLINGVPVGSPYTGTKDTYINRWKPTNNMGGEARLMFGQSRAYRPLVYFDLAAAAIPSSATIISAELGIYCYARNIFREMEGQVYQVVRHWEESEATWYKATNADFWDIEGCDQTTTDRMPTASMTRSLFARNDFHYFDVATIVQDWVSNPANNEGFILIGPDPAVIYYYRSSEWNTDVQRPQLVISWTLEPVSPTPTPTPTQTGTPGPTPTPTTTPAPGVVLDETSACYSHSPPSGVWQTGTTGGYGGNYEYESTSVLTATARWGPCEADPILVDSMYDLQTHWSVHSARPEAVPYEIHYDGGVVTVYVDQTKDATGATVADFSPSGWHSLGVYPFRAGTYTTTGEYVELNTSSTGDTCADAVRWVQLLGVSGPPYALTISADPTELPSDGASISTIAVTVTDKYGNMVNDGTMVGLTTTLGTLPYAYTEAEDAPVTKLGSWTTLANANASDGSHIRSSSFGAEVSWTFQGEAISMIYRTAATGGVADVIVDGTYVTTINFASASTQWQVERQFTTALSSGTHTIRVRNGGVGPIWLDAFRSGTTTTGGVATATLIAPLVPGTATVGAVGIGAGSTGSAPTWPYGQTTVSFPGPAEVWVDDDYCSTCPNDGHIWDYTAFDTIQGGVDRVLSGGTVHVLAGIYAGNVTVDKPLYLDGAGNGVVFVQGSDAPGSRGFYVDRADNVTISGFNIQDFEKGIYLDGTSGNRVYNATIVYNAFESNSVGSSSYAMYGIYVYTSTICSNDITIGHHGIYLQYVDGTTICYNDIYDNSGVAVTINTGNDNSIDNCNIHDNQDVGVELAGTTLRNGVYGNVIHDLAWDGVLVNGTGTSTVDVGANIIERTNLSWLNASGPPDANHNRGGVVLIGTTNSSVYDNRIADVSNAGGNRADAAGVSLRSNTAPISIENNLIENCVGHGIHIPPGGGVATVHGNSIYSNGRFGLSNQLAANVHVEGNWWGCNTLAFGPGEPGDIRNAGSAFWSPPISVSLTTAPASIPANGTSTADVTAMASGYGYNILDGTWITFSSDLNSVIFPTMTVFAGGQANAILTAGTIAGVATITGTAEPGRCGVAVTMTLAVNAPHSVAIAAYPQTIFNACDTLRNRSYVTFTVWDVYGNPVPNVPITFSSSGPGFVFPASATTMYGTGVATTTLTADLLTGVATVTGAAGVTLTASTNVNVTAGPPVTPTITADPGCPTILPANGVITSVITVTMTDCAANPVADGTMVGFTTTLGTILDHEYVEAESADVFTSGSWTTVAAATASGGQYIRSNSPGSAAHWLFRGGAVSLIYRRYSSGGVLRVRVDGGVPRDIGTSGTPAAWVEEVVATNLDPAAVHELEVVHQSGSTIRLDAFRSGAAASGGVATAILRAPALAIMSPTEVHTATVHATTRIESPPSLVVTDTVCFGQADIIWVDDDWAGLPDGTPVTVPGGTAGIGVDAFDTIPEGATAVKTGGTVRVLAGDYPESVAGAPIVITKTMNLLGDGSANTFIIGSGSGNGIRMRAVSDNATIEGFAIRDFDYGVWLDGRSGNSLDSVTFVNNVITESVTGAITATYVNGGYFADNDLYSNSGFGFDLQTGDNNRIMNNHIYDNGGFGLRVFSSAGTSTGNVLSYNTIYDVAWNGLIVGANCVNTSVSHNSITTTNSSNSPSGFNEGGIVLYSSSNTTVEHNMVSDVGTAGGSTDTAGIWVGGTDAGATIQFNHFLDNDNDGILLWSFNAGSPPVIHCNHIYGNGRFGLRSIPPAATAVVDAEDNWWGRSPPTRGTSPPKDIYRPTSMNVDWSPPITLTLTPAATTVSAGGPAIVITAIACDTSCCILDNTPITFTTDIVGGSGLGSPPASSVADVMIGGQATVMFTPGTVRRVATITGTLANNGVATTTVTIQPLGPASISVSANPGTIVVGTGTSAITATVQDIYGNKVAYGTGIDFSTSLGFINPVSNTTSNGVATSTLTAGAIPGTATVRAWHGAVFGTRDVQILAGPPFTITSMVAYPSAILADGVSTSLIAVDVVDQFGNPVPDGTGVGFTTTAGSLIYDYVEAEDPPVAKVGSWTTQSHLNASNGQYIRTTTVGDEAAWSFRGEAVSLRYRQRSGNGRIQVRVDGGAVRTIDTNGASMWIEDIMATNLSAGAAHTITVLCLDAARVELDAFRSAAATSGGRAVATLTSQLLPPATAVVWATGIGGTFPVATTTVQFVEPIEVWVDDDYCATCLNDGHIWGFDAFSNMPDGIAVVRSGGTVHVLSGVYTLPVTINKPLYLDGDGSGATSTLVGSGTGNGILVTRFADGTTIEGFLIRNWGYGLKLDGRSANSLDGVSVTDNVIDQCVTGAITATYVNDGYFADNSLDNNSGFGFDLHTGSNNMISHNHIYDNDGFGLRVFSSGGTSTGNVVSDNRIYDVSWNGIVAGLNCVNTQVVSNTVYGTNQVNSPSGFNEGGIVLYSTTNTTVEYNTVYDVGTAGGSTDTAGIWVGGTNAGGVIRYNRILDNSNDGVLLAAFNWPPLINCNHIYGNGRFGLRSVPPAATAIVDAEGNWWGRQPPPTRGTVPPKDIHRPTPMNVDWNPAIALTLTPAQPTVHAGGPAIAITAEGRGGGCCLLDTTPVTFETDLGGLGGPPASSVVAHTGGCQAVAMFTPGSMVGTATITATVANAGVVTTTVQIEPGLPYSMTFSAAPHSIWVWSCRPAGYPRKSTIAVTVTDQFGNPNVGESITWTVSGALGEHLEWRYGTLDPNGYHLTILDSGDIAGTVSVTATVGSLSRSVPVEIMPSVPASVLLQRAPTGIAANGVSTAIITATVYDQCGNLAYDGTMVGFATDYGTLPYEYVEAESSEVITSTGDWTLVANANASSGYYLRTSTPGALLQWEFTGSAVSLIYRRTTTGGQAQVFVDGVIRKTLDMSAASTEWQRETAIVTGLDPAVTHYIDVKCDTGPIYVDALRSGVDTTNGVTTAVLTSEQMCTTATITGTAVDPRVEAIYGPPYDTTTVEFQCVDLTISKQASPVDVLPDALVTFTLSYANVGPAVATDTRITDTLPMPLIYVSSQSSPYLGAPQSPSSDVWVWQAGDVLPGGTGVITLTARRPCIDWRGIVTNTVSIGSPMADLNLADNDASAWVSLVADEPAMVTVTAQPPSILVDSSSTIRITVTDHCGNPVSAWTVYITTNLGAFDAAGTVTHRTRTTNANGRITLTFWSRPPVRGTATISATAGSVTGLGTVIVGVGPAQQCLAEADPPAIPADGLSTSTITAVVLDTGGNPVLDGFFVGFTTSLGSMLYGYAEDADVNQSPPGSWPTSSHAAASGGSYIGTTVDGASVYWNFRGNGASIVYRLAPAGGIGDVYVDGSFLGSIDMSGPLTWRAERTFTWSGSPTDTHLLRLTHRVGTGRIWMDAFRSGLTTSGEQALAVLTSETTVGIATVAATAVSETVTAVPVLLHGFADVRFDPADLIITKTIQPTDPVSVGHRITFTIEYQNLGPITATNAYLDDVIEDGVLDSAWLRDAFFNTTPVTVIPHLQYQWPLGSLASGESGIIVFGGIVAENRFWPSETVITNTAVIESRTVDPRRGNNTRRITTTIVPGVPVTMTLTAMPGSIPVDGNTSLLRATIWDVYGNPIANGTPVTFKTSLGGFPAAQERVRYTTDGAVAVNLTSGTVAGTAIITATVDSISATTQVVFTPLNPRRITLTADPDEIVVGGATSIIEAVVVDRLGNAVTDGTSVAFATTDGTIAPLVVPTVQGRASTVLTSGAAAVTATVSAFAGSAVGTTTVRFVPGEPRVTITADPTDLTVGNNSAITVITTDEFGNPVLDGTVVTFTTSFGYFTDTMISTTFGNTLGGVADVLLTSRVVGTAIVRGAVGADSAAVAVTFSAGEPHSIEIISVEPGVIPGCVGTALATVVVKDRYGNFVTDGTVVVFDVTPQGDVEPIDGGRTTNGVAQAIISAGTVPGPATVWAWPERYRTSVVDQYGITFLVGPPDYIEASVEPPRLMAGGSRATVRVRVLDCGGYPVTDGTLVTFTIASGQGSLTPQSTTTASGWAFSTLTSPEVAGSAIIRVTSGEREANVVVEYIPGPPFEILLTADPWSIPANGVYTSTISAEIKDLFGNHVADRTAVVFSTDLGRFETGISYSTSTLGGRASAVLISSTTPGIARVAATAGGRRAETYVDFYFEPTPTPPPSMRWKAYLPIIVKNRYR